MSEAGRNTFHVAPQHAALVREVGLDAEAVFDREDIKPWRTLADRENCLLDATAGSGTSVRLHIKRFPATAQGTPAADEVRGIELLQRAGIPTVPLVGWGTLADGRSFVVSLDLDGFRDSEKLVRDGMPFSLLIHATAEAAAKLHNAGLHHRDLYLCHFFSRVSGDRSCDVSVRLIDAARVKRLPRLFRNRWIVKDLAQFWYSTTKLPGVTDEDRAYWLDQYAHRRSLPSTWMFRRAIVHKANWIARHDRKLNAKQPTRNVSLPGEGAAP